VERGTRKPGSDILIGIKRAFNVSLDWLLTGRGPMFLDAEVRTIAVEPGAVEEGDRRVEDYVLIPFHKEVRISAGQGTFAGDGEVTPVAISSSYLKRRLGLVSLRGLSLVPIHGDSMEPNLPDGSYAIVQDWKVEGVLIDGRVYVVLVDDLLYIKRVYFNSDKKVLYLVSDNQGVPTIEVEWTDRVRIIGRVVGCVNIKSL
jgi:phage repressor protein C with HTH and peptisase S24 domain